MHNHQAKIKFVTRDMAEIWLGGIHFLSFLLNHIIRYS